MLDRLQINRQVDMQISANQINLKDHRPPVTNTPPEHWSQTWRAVVMVINRLLERFNQSQVIYRMINEVQLFLITLILLPNDEASLFIFYFRLLLFPTQICVEMEEPDGVTRVLEKIHSTDLSTNKMWYDSEFTDDFKDQFS